MIGLKFETSSVHSMITQLTFYNSRVYILGGSWVEKFKITVKTHLDLLVKIYLTVSIKSEIEK